ncbi:MAG: hypothetical protein MN733_14640 [Nitrososphaera sp.]|nr:hypothetical protein [Nitrososphaera sp.]
MNEEDQGSDGLLPVAVFVNSSPAFCPVMTPAAIHKIFEMTETVSVGDSPFLAILWGRRTN